MRKERLEALDGIIETLSVKTSYEVNRPQEERFIQSQPEEFVLNSGDTIYRERLVKGKSDGSASIVIPVVDGQILTIVEPRVYTKRTVGVSFPAGYLEKGESHLDCALRELKEETGYVSDELIEIDTFYQDEGCSRALNKIYLALNCKKVSEQMLDQGEFIKYMFFDYQELLELEQMQYIMGAHSKLALVKIGKYFKEK